MTADVLRTMIVDDEPLARQRLRRLLGVHAEVHIVGEAADVPTARTQIAVLKPSLLFLDVSMPGEDGFSLLADLPPELRPFVVFVTAHPDAAVRAFDARATDFLVKPVRAERLAESVARARDAAQQQAAAPAPNGTWDAEVRAALSRLVQAATEGGRHEGPRAAPHAGRTAAAPNPTAMLRHFAVTVGRRTRFVKVEDVEWLQAEGNYVRLHCGREQHLIRTTMQRLEQQLDAVRFVRIHRSTIIQLDRVKELVLTAPGEYHVVLQNGQQLEVMRTYRDRLPLAAP